MNQTIIFVDTAGQALSYDQLIGRGKPLQFGSLAASDVSTAPRGWASVEGGARMDGEVTQGVTAATRHYLQGVLHSRRLELYGEKRRWEAMRCQPNDYANLIADCDRELVQIEVVLGELA
jgi:hypothetical protein